MRREIMSEEHEVFRGEVRRFVEKEVEPRVAGWNESERAVLQASIAERQPFLDFVFSRVNTDGSQQKFRVSGEPMFNQHCGFIGYRGIGVELTAKK